VWRIVLIIFCLSGCALIHPVRYERYIKYPLRADDTLPKVAERFEVSVQELRRKNHLQPDEKLAPGEYLLIPYRGQSLQRERGDVLQVEEREEVQPEEESVKMLALNRARIYEGKLTWPVRSGVLTSRFGRRWSNFHEGIDLSARDGTPVLAAHDGQVVYSGAKLRGYGNLVVLKGEGLLTIYAHNQRNLVRIGMHVRRGEQIAQVGHSGHATGSHLHFETRIKDAQNKNAAVDPLVFFP
jgi:murein DD-endopeptidase MepM/ murein hydrolase activator NlpD